jgi:hypothetical protein
LKNEILAVILMLLVVGSLGVGYLSGASNRQTTTLVSTDTTTFVTTYTTTSSIVSTMTRTQSVLAGTGCSTPVRQPPAGTNDTNLFYLSESSEAAICITYQYEGKGNATFGPNLDYVMGGGGMTVTSCLLHPCSGVNVSVSPTFVQYDGLTNITVTYRFTTSAGLQVGLYWLLVNSCAPVVFVYGQNYTRINIGGVGATFGCFAGSPTPVNVWPVGVSNMTVSAVPVYE